MFFGWKGTVFMRREIEILAPAGSYEGMKGAMNAGCDAVYIGGGSFGARAYANNLEEDMLLRAIDEAHIRDKKLYLTVNTLIKEKERKDQLYSYLEKYYEQGLDAVIVQDTGVMHFIHSHFPKLAIHASTQMTLTMAQGANLLKDCGVTRIVTSRELTLSEIKNISKNTDLEIETFVHGALCYCYSGQCLMSSMIGGRSGNRGRCAQPCRMPYQYYSNQKKLSAGQEKYLLSPKDINTIELIPELVEAGIHSFKIEGRMKRPEYAAAVAYLYRKYTDLYLSQGREEYGKHLAGKEFEQDMIMLQDVYNRGGFSQGYSKTYHGKSMMSLYRPNHSGVFVGNVSQVNGSSVSIRLAQKVNAQDILEIRHNPEDGYEFTVKDSHKAGEEFNTNVGRRYDKPKGDKSVKNKGEYKSPVILVGEPVYRTKNNELLERLGKHYLQVDKRLGIKGVLTARLGERLTLSLNYRGFHVTVYQDMVQAAMKQPVTKDKLQMSLMKTGDSLYYFEELQVNCDDNIFVPVGWVNEIRREGIGRLEDAVKNHYRREEADTNLSKDRFPQIDTEVRVGKVQNTFPGINVSVQNKGQFDMVIKFSEIEKIYIDCDYVDWNEIIEMSDQTKQAGKKLYIMLPHICRLSVYNRLKKEICGIINNMNITGFVVKNFEEVSLIKSLIKEYGVEKDILLNHNMYIFNKEAKEFWKEQGITRFSAPLELTYQELKQLDIQDCELLVYGYIPLMISAQCLHESTQGCEKCNDHNTGYLVDRMGKKFLVQTNCMGCYNTIYNGQAMSLHKYQGEIATLQPLSIRIDFTVEEGGQLEEVLQCFVDIYSKGIRSGYDLADYTTGHFKRGVE